MRWNECKKIRTMVGMQYYVLSMTQEIDNIGCNPQIIPVSCAEIIIIIVVQGTAKQTCSANNWIFLWIDGKKWQISANFNDWHDLNWKLLATSHNWKHDKWQLMNHMSCQWQLKENFW